MKKSIAAIVAVCTLSLAPATSFAKESAPKKKLNPVVHICKKDDSSVNALACNIYMESRGETISGQMAVGFVTLNRLKHDGFPHSMKKVVYQPSQFSWTLTKGSFKVRDAESWKVAQDVAKFLYKIRDNELLYHKLDPTYGSTYFHTKKVKPYWVKYFKRMVIIDNHIFYKPKEETA